MEKEFETLLDAVFARCEGEDLLDRADLYSWCDQPGLTADVVYLIMYITPQSHFIELCELHDSMEGGEHLVLDALVDNDLLTYDDWACAYVSPYEMEQRIEEGEVERQHVMQESRSDIFI